MNVRTMNVRTVNARIMNVRTINDGTLNVTTTLCNPEFNRTRGPGASVKIEPKPKRPTESPSASPQTRPQMELQQKRSFELGRREHPVHVAI